MFAKTALLVLAVVAVASAAPKPVFPLAYTAPVAYTAPAVAAPVAYTAPLAYTAPIAPVASSSQVIARNYNGLAAAYYAPGAAYVF
ncbi:cuticle protein 18.6-like [Ischnura elegans]|uniref:cuticle protein 18.6-like n=1 Tax=Ischnura elegans TaxID=197161 RepID=UPI001ED86D96|nr:cuticle protein 18.6-like [Ischnura elegans]